MFESPSNEFFSRLRAGARRAASTSLYYNAAEKRGAVSTDTLAWMAGLFFALACNQPVWALAMQGRSFTELATWGFAAALLIVLTTTHVVLLGLVLHRAFAKLLLGLLLVATAFAVHWLQTPGAHLDPAALRALAALDLGRLREAWGQGGLWADLLLYAVLPLLVLWRIKLAPRPWPQALGLRGANLLVALLLGAGSLLAAGQDFETLRRDDPALRFLITPANFLYSLNRLLT